MYFKSQTHKNQGRKCFLVKKGMPTGQFSLMDNNNFPPILYDNDNHARFFVNQKIYNSWKSLIDTPFLPRTFSTFIMHNKF